METWGLLRLRREGGACDSRVHSLALAKLCLQPPRTFLKRSRPPHTINFFQIYIYIFEKWKLGGTATASEPEINSAP